MENKGPGSMKFSDLRRKGYCETGPKDYPLGNIESSSIEFHLTTARLEL